MSNRSPSSTPSIRTSPSNWKRSSPSRAGLAEPGIHTILEYQHECRRREKAAGRSPVPPRCSHVQTVPRCRTSGFEIHPTPQSREAARAAGKSRPAIRTTTAPPSVTGARNARGSGTAILPKRGGVITFKMFAFVFMSSQILNLEEGDADVSSRVAGKRSRSRNKSINERLTNRMANDSVSVFITT